MKAELIPQSNDPPIPIVRDVTVIGRREYCDLVVPHPSLSKRHCVLVRTDGLLILRDLISTNGTKVNGQRVVWAALLPNDRLTIGRMKYRIYLGPDDAPSPSERWATQATVAGRPGPAGAPGRSSVVMTGFPAPSSHQLPVVANRPGSAPIPAAPLPDLEPLLDDDDLEILDDAEDIIELD